MNTVHFTRGVVKIRALYAARY